MNIETWPLDKIIPYEKNAKLHQVEWIATSIREFQPDQPIVVDGDGVIIKGHGRLKAAQSLGLKEFPVVVRTDLTPEQVRLARIADNRTNEGGWDADLLSAEISELMRDLPSFDFDSLGMSSDWFSQLNVSINTESAPNVQFKEYDESIADDVELCHCATCGNEHARKK